MTIYNFNKGIGWASSGVEYAQAYRSNIFRKNKQKAKFIFTDMFQVNIEPMTKNIGFEDDEVIWIYQYFTDVKIHPTTYSITELENGFPVSPDHTDRQENKVVYTFKAQELRLIALLDPTAQGEKVFKVETYFKNNLLQRDYYNYVKIYSEYFKPVGDQAHLYQRRFFNQNGTCAYDELLNGEQNLYIFDDRTLYSFEDLMLYFMECLDLKSQDILIMDRSTGIGPEIVRGKGKARLGVVIHAEHFNEPLSTDEYILWNNFYDYQFENANSIDFFITATQKQKDLLEGQFKRYHKGKITVYAIPVGSIDERQDSPERKVDTLMTASRLASEKHIDWLIEAVVEARKEIPGLGLDIYGEGGELMKLSALIHKREAGEYIKLMGQQDLKHVYKNYAVYLAGSTSEGFGLTLLEAVGSGLSLIGFDVRYGNQNFIEDGENGYLLPYIKNDNLKNIQALTSAIIAYHKQSPLQKESAKRTSYRIAQPFLTDQVRALWMKSEKEVAND